MKKWLQNALKDDATVQLNDSLDKMRPAVKRKTEKGRDAFIGTPSAQITMENKDEISPLKLKSSNRMNSEVLENTLLNISTEYGLGKEDLETRKRVLQRVFTNLRELYKGSVK